jgi:hypothetical protein
MTLSQKQQAFAVLVAELILHVHSRGWAVTFGEAYRSKEEAARLARTGAGIKNSLHVDRLAVDLNLFIDGTYQNASEAYRPLGEWWEAQSTADLTCAWGGRFGDGNHFSVGHGGRK